MYVLFRFNEFIARIGLHNVNEKAMKQNLT